MYLLVHGAVLCFAKCPNYTMYYLVLHFISTLEQWEAQQELLKLRNASPEVRDKYFEEVSRFSLIFLYLSCSLFSDQD